MNPPQVHMCSLSWTLLPPPSPFHPSGSSQCTSPKHPVDYFYLLVVQETLKSLLQHHNLKASILGCAVFIMVQLSHLHMTNGSSCGSQVHTIFFVWICPGPQTDSLNIIAHQCLRLKATSSIVHPLYVLSAFSHNLFVNACSKAGSLWESVLLSRGLSLLPGKFCV